MAAKGLLIEISNNEKLHLKNNMIVIKPQNGGRKGNPLGEIKSVNFSFSTNNELEIVLSSKIKFLIMNTN